MSGTERIVFADQLKTGDIIVDKVELSPGGHWLDLPIEQLTVGQTRLGASGRVIVTDVEHTRTEFLRTSQRLRIHRETD
ncbi:hypothetical protein [Rhodococcoides kyotonense]|uniref:Uncharacterized protein n=1 Tax=Rhodococcoides kyotonense TaxID=398843 RepID=A0A239FQU2_9NOCA|nr:hypothetical protein [Rhodococcus kyotonensis]SNS59261.1 hypothetical protein SAMN05421642_103415 [Rhodococcus kyotonensis]